ncbi:MAG: hypothetical protein K2Y37_16855 [Pirellulales bacterium]|nr:hypothetical protein [Pirellulales bacterium]
MKLATRLCLALAIAALVGHAHVAQAQIRDAGAKIRGDSGYSHRGGYRSMWHARDYAGDYRSYAADANREKRRVTPEEAQDTAEGLGHNIKKAQKHFADARKHAAGDKETLAALDKIDALLATALKSHAEMAEMCKHEEIDADGTMKCCTDAEAALEKAIAEHEKLMKRLAAKPAK